MNGVSRVKNKAQKEKGRERKAVNSCPRSASRCRGDQNRNSWTANMASEGNNGDAAIQLESVEVKSSAGADAERGEVPVSGTQKLLASRIEGISLQWQNVSLTVDMPSGEPKSILRECSGELRRGRMGCIMGPSGAGKTTLMNILAGRVSAPWTGCVMANGSAVNPAEFRRQIAYVMQEDALCATQTPREALEFSAALRLHDLSAADRRELVDTILKQLELEKCADSLIGNIMIRGISGGEKKRVSIGVELITQPKVLFLDEPTSGLDTWSAFNVVRMLKGLCKRGCSVISTIHQPSSEIFHEFDDCILLESGLIVYDGAILKMKEHFDALGDRFKCPNNFNLADHVMFLMQKKETKEDRDGIETIRKAWRGREAKDSKESAVKTGPKGVVAATPGSNSSFRIEYEASAPMTTQMGMLLRREGLNVIRDKKSLIARVVITSFLNLLFGVVFYDVGSSTLSARFGGVLQLLISAMFGNAQPVLLTFPYERPVFIREYLTGTYGILPYVTTKFLIEAPMAMAQSLLGLTCGYFLMNLKGEFFTMWVACFLLATVSASVAVLLGSIATNVKMAVELMPLVFVPQLLFAGFFVDITHIPVFVRWAQWLCSLKYSVNIAIINEFRNGTPESDKLLDDLQAKKSDVGFYIAMLLVLLLGFRTLAAIGLRSTARAVQE